jgi:hypothetical protein
MGERVSHETQEAERGAMSVSAGAREVPTPDEEAAADRYGDASESTRERHQDDVEKAAAHAGEGRIP